MRTMAIATTGTSSAVGASALLAKGAATASAGKLAMHTASMKPNARAQAPLRCFGDAM